VNPKLRTHYRVACYRVVEYAASVEDLNLSAIRTIRVLRPLRAINRVPSKFLITASM